MSCHLLEPGEFSAVAIDTDPYVRITEHGLIQIVGDRGEVVHLPVLRTVRALAYQLCEAFDELQRRRARSYSPPPPLPIRFMPTAHYRGSEWQADADKQSECQPGEGSPAVDPPGRGRA